MGGWWGWGWLQQLNTKDVHCRLNPTHTHTQKNWLIGPAIAMYAWLNKKAKEPGLKVLQSELVDG